MGFKNNFVSHQNVESDRHNSIEKRYNYIFNSNNGTLLRPPNKGLFNVSFTTTIKLPSEATSIQVGLHSANIVNNVYNITATQYNTITFIVNGDTQTLTLPPGSYTPCDVQKTINALLIEAYPTISPPPQITLLANNATQKISIRFDIAGMSIDWGNSTIGFLLGFDNVDIQPPFPPGSTEGEIIEADVEARFNWPITNFLIICNELVGDGLPLNNVGLGIIGAVPITAAPGSLIAYEAQNILWIQCDQLAGQNLSSLTFQLTNERGEEIQINDDFNFTVVIKITY